MRKSVALRGNLSGYARPDNPRRISATATATTCTSIFCSCNAKICICLDPIRRHCCPLLRSARTPRRSFQFGMGTLNQFESSRLPVRPICRLVMSRDVNRPELAETSADRASLLPTRHPARHSPSGRSSYAAVKRCLLVRSRQILAFVAALPGFQDMPAATRATPIAASTFFAHAGRMPSVLARISVNAVFLAPPPAE